MLYCLVGCLCISAAPALDPSQAFARYSRTLWTQKDGLPQDTIRKIVQTTDGYLWVGTEEGLARFDGYDFAVFNKENGALPSNSVTALAAATDGSLWIGTADGVVHYKDKIFHVYSTKDGLSANLISDLYLDHAGTLWIVAGGMISRFEGNKITRFAEGKDIPFTVFTMCEDRHNVLWVAGFSGLAQWNGKKFVSMIDAATMDGNLITALVADGNDNLWMGGPRGVVRRSADGKIRKFDTRDGLPHIFVRSLLLDHNGILWAGTNSGFARMRDNRFTSLTGPQERERDSVWCLYEDREGNLWAGVINGLSRFRHDIFTTYGESEGLPGDDPVTFHEDRSGRAWVGFHNSGLTLFTPGGSRVFNTGDGLPSNEIFSIRDARDGSLLLATRGGLVRMRDSQFSTFLPMDDLGRNLVLDALEDRSGKLWLALPGGLGVLQADKLRVVIPAEGPLLDSWTVSLFEGSDGALWAGTYGKGLWRVQGRDKRHFTTESGLSSNQIRSLLQDHEGTLWIATFGGGLNAFRDGSFSHFTVKDGLLSDNISNIVDDGESLWLGTARGLCRIAKKQLHDFAQQKIQRLQPTNYGVVDGLRSAQCAPGYPVAGGGGRSADGRLWFPTSRGLAVIDPDEPQQPEPAPTLNLIDFVVDGKTLDPSQSQKLRPGSERIQIRYTAIHLSAPERIQYSHRLEGLDADWVRAEHRREINYNSLPHGKYRFLVRAELPGSPPAETGYDFEILPRFYETAWFRLLCAGALIAGAWGVYRLRVRQLRYRFALVLQERARLAREIHDTLAQGFVGISSQLEAVATELPEDVSPARQHLDMARKMARHSITEARRSVVDLRSSVLEGQSLAGALNSSAQVWVAGSGVAIEVDVSSGQGTLPEEFEQHLLRIAQEAVTNVLKHAAASKIWIKLSMKDHKVYLSIVDNGRGFEQQDAFSPVGGHFGLIGMRERAEQLGGELRLVGHSGQGTRVEVAVPLS